MHHLGIPRHIQSVDKTNPEESWVELLVESTNNNLPQEIVKILYAIDCVPRNSAGMHCGILLKNVPYEQALI